MEISNNKIPIPMFTSSNTENFVSINEIQINGFLLYHNKNIVVDHDLKNLHSNVQNYIQ